MASDDHSYSEAREEVSTGTEAVHCDNGGQFPTQEVDDEYDLSLIDENYDVASIPSSVEDHLT